MRWKISEGVTTENFPSLKEYLNLLIQQAYGKSYENLERIPWLFSG